MTATVRATRTGAGLCRVYINDVLHLAFSTEKLAEVQAWKVTTREPANFVIERTYLGGASQQSEYDHEGIWRDVLAAIDGAFGKVRSFAAEAAHAG